MPNTTPNLQRLIKVPAGLFIIQITGFVTAAVGAIALLGWVLGFPRLASLGAGLIPMAPSTALLFILFGLTITRCASESLPRRLRRQCAAVVALGMMTDLVLLVAATQGVRWKGEHLGLSLDVSPLELTIGHMSPATAILFLLAGVCFLASLVSTGVRPGYAKVALGCAGILLATCAVLLLAYLLGTPLLYGGTVIPPAATTMLAFAALGIGLWILAYRQIWPLVEPPESTLSEHPSRALVLTFSALAIGIVTLGTFYYRNYERHFRSEVERQLSAIAELKVGELAQWRTERFGDANVLHQNAAFTRLVRSFMNKPEDTEAQQLLQIWLEKYQVYNHYDRVFLLDTQDVTRMSVPARAEPISRVLFQRAAEVRQSGQIVLQDFSRYEHNQRIYLALLVPILDEADANRPLGVLVLSIDPRTYLYPYIQHWPTASRTAETLLVRREGNAAMFLNVLRFQTNAALALHSSLEMTNLPAVKAVMGQTGVLDGVDYRGVPVVADVRAVPESPWFLVSKMDLVEVYAPLRERLWWVVFLMGVLLLGAGAGVGMVWRQQRVHFYRERYEAAKVLRHTQAMLQAALDQSQAGIAIADAPSGALRYVNDAGLLIRGRDRHTAVNGVGINQYVASWQLLDIDGRPLNNDEVPLARAILFGETCSREFIIRRASDDDRIVLAKAAPIRDDDGKVVAGIVVFMDITEQKRAEAEIHKLNAQLEQRVVERTAQLQSANQELEAFSYTVSHDLRAPLRHIDGYVELLVNRFRDALPDKGRHYLDTIADAARQMGRLIDDLLHFSRTGRTELHKVGLDMNQVLQEALVPLQVGCAGRAIEWTIGDLPPVHGDAAMLRQVWTNLLSNAIKYTGTRAPAQIAVGACVEGAEIVFFVRDNGVGFDMQYVHKLFGVFQRLHPVEDFEGTGIGLASVRRIVTRHGGRTWAEAELDQGATFYFTLPIAAATVQTGEVKKEMETNE
jgi:PAS domain S-box-containing protein